MPHRTTVNPLAYALALLTSVLLTSTVSARTVVECRDSDGTLSFRDHCPPNEAKTGEKRSVPLAYQVIDGRLVIIASMGGSHRNPPWFHNLVKNPKVMVEKDGESFMTSAVVTEGEDRNYLYQKVCEVLPAFNDYQARTSRVIPVVELKRVG